MGVFVDGLSAIPSPQRLLVKWPNHPHQNRYMKYAAASRVFEFSLPQPSLVFSLPHCSSQPITTTTTTNSNHGRWVRFQSLSLYIVVCVYKYRCMEDVLLIWFTHVFVNRKNKRISKGKKGGKKKAWVLQRKVNVFSHLVSRSVLYFDLLLLCICFL